MRQVLALLAGALLAAAGAVVLGEYPLEGTTAIIGFPLYGIAVAELALAIGKRLAPAAVAAVAAIVAGGLAWALWISFGHFRNDVLPPLLSWVMVAVAAVAAVAWIRPGRRAQREGTEPPEPSQDASVGATDEASAPPAAMKMTQGGPVVTEGAVDAGSTGERKRVGPEKAAAAGPGGSAGANGAALGNQGGPVPNGGAAPEAAADLSGSPPSRGRRPDAAGADEEDGARAPGPSDEEVDP